MTSQLEASFSSLDQIIQQKSVISISDESNVQSSPSCSNTISFGDRESPHSQVTTSILLDLANELIKVIAALYTLKLTDSLEERREPTLSSPNISPSPAASSPKKHIDQSPHTPSSDHDSSETVQVKVTPESAQNCLGECKRDPFIRIVTQCHGTLIHLGQLMGILDDYSAIVLRGVVSIDPRRVQIRMVADLKPTDICALIESKRQTLEHRSSRRKSLEGQSGAEVLTQLLTRTKGQLDGDRPQLIRTDIDESNDDDHQNVSTNLTPQHGPILITPGLVLIRVGQIRDLGIIAENESVGLTDLYPWFTDLDSSTVVESADKSPSDQAVVNQQDIALNLVESIGQVQPTVLVNNSIDDEKDSSECVLLSPESESHPPAAMVTSTVDRATTSRGSLGRSRGWNHRVHSERSIPSNSTQSQLQGGEITRSQRGGRHLTRSWSMRHSHRQQGQRLSGQSTISNTIHHDDAIVSLIQANPIRGTFPSRRSRSHRASGLWKPWSRRTSTFMAVQ